MTEGPLLLLVEDEGQMRRFLRASLTSRGYRLIEAVTTQEAVVQATGHNPDLILLDLGLPDGDGIDFTRRLREWTRVPIIVISARGREEDKVIALDAGADDYLTKPFGMNELLARIRVALRHAKGSAAAAPAEDARVEVGDISIDRARHEVKVEGRDVKLTPIEFKLLVLLAENVGRVLTHRQIARAVWGPTDTVQAHHVRVHMAELRKKVERDPARPRYLATEPGVGYRMRDDAR